MWKIWTIFQDDGPDHLGLWLNIVRDAAVQDLLGAADFLAGRPGVDGGESHLSLTLRPAFP